MERGICITRQDHQEGLLGRGTTLSLCGDTADFHIGGYLIVVAILGIFVEGSFVPALRLAVSDLLVEFSFRNLYSGKIENIYNRICFFGFALADIRFLVV